MFDFLERFSTMRYKFLQCKHYSWKYIGNICIASLCVEKFYNYKKETHVVSMEQREKEGKTVWLQVKSVKFKISRTHLFLSQK